ncbi:hypothetical protein BDW62DRAFT_195531 [Aspergillus aurantiobrunneus]
MHFAKVLSATLFAATATAAPAQVSVDLAAVQQLAQDVESFASETDSGISRLSSEYDGMGFSGQLQEQLNEQFQQLEESNSRIQGAAGAISQALQQTSSTYEQADDAAASRFE